MQLPRAVARGASSDEGREARATRGGCGRWLVGGMLFIGIFFFLVDRLSNLTFKVGVLCIVAVRVRLLTLYAVTSRTALAQTQPLVCDPPRKR